jgi:hypothetical protein
MHFTRIRMIGLALVAVFAFGALAATSALAQPEFIRCAKVAAGEPSSWEAGCITKKASGGYAKVSAGPGTCVKVAPGEPSSWSNATCTTAKKGTGEYIKVAAAGKLNFTDKEKVSNFYATSSVGVPIVFTCTADTSKGEITGNTTTAGVTVTFTGCTAREDEKASCSAKSTGEPAGTIKTNGLRDVLGTVAAAEAASEVGDALEPEGKEGFVTLEAECVELKKVQVLGSVIGEVPTTMINVMQTTGELIFTCNATTKTKQTIQKFVGVAKDTLSYFGNPACFESQDEIRYEEPIEVT